MLGPDGCWVARVARPLNTYTLQKRILGRLYLRGHMAWRPYSKPRGWEAFLSMLGRNRDCSPIREAASRAPISQATRLQCRGRRRRGSRLTHGRPLDLHKRRGRLGEEALVDVLDARVSAVGVSGVVAAASPGPWKNKV